MKAIIVTTGNEAKTVELNTKELMRELNHAVHGWIEIVRPQNIQGGMPLPYGAVMVVNEEGRLIRLPRNAFGSLVYGGIIAGDVVIICEGMTDEGPDFIDFNEHDFLILEATVRKWCDKISRIP